MQRSWLYRHLKPEIENIFNKFTKNRDAVLFEYQQLWEKEKLIEYCGFKKFHPHDKQSVIRMAYTSPMDRVNIKQQLKTISKSFIDVFNGIQKMFS